MAMMAPRRFSVLEYLQKERQAETKSEFVNGEIFAMAGASVSHNDLTYTLLLEIGNQMRGGECRAYGSDLRIRVESSDLYTYPDISIVCGKPILDPNDPYSVVNPSVIFEVLSNSTELWDRGGKFAHYRLLPTLREYVLVSQSEPRLERYVRHGEQWTLTEFVGLEAIFTLSTIEVKVPLAVIYERIEFPERIGRT